MSNSGHFNRKYYLVYEETPTTQLKFFLKNMTPKRNKNSYEKHIKTISCRVIVLINKGKECYLRISLTYHGTRKIINWEMGNRRYEKTTSVNFENLEKCIY